MSERCSWQEGADEVCPSCGAHPYNGNPVQLQPPSVCRESSEMNEREASGCCDQTERNPLPDWLNDPDFRRKWVRSRAHVFGIHEWPEDSEKGVFARAVLAMLEEHQI